MTPVTFYPGMKLESLEQLAIESAFTHYRGNKTATAQSLGIAIRTLENKLEKYEATRNTERNAADERSRTRETQLARSRGIANPVPQHDTSIDNSRPPSGFEIEAGFRLESAAVASSQQAMSMPIGAEVQKVLPVAVTARRAHGRG
jgi:hypothetical protein